MSSLTSFQSNHSNYRHALVIGSSIAGFTAARVLADHFEQVTVIERDCLPNGTDFRKGIPQSRHPHALLVRGQQILEHLFPGLRHELLEKGAIPINMGADFPFQVMGEWLPRFHSTVEGTACSRVLLEGAIYQRLAEYANIHFVQEAEVARLCVDGNRVIGVQIRLRNRLEDLPADLVVDASGRDSKTPEWLAELGYTPPKETIINAFPGYATRIYECPADGGHPWKGIYVMPAAPHKTRGGIILPMEGNRWHISLIGMSADYPPTDEAGFLEFAQSLSSPRIYEAIKDARPLTAPYGYRRAENRLRHYDKLPRYLEGLLVLGDAVYAFNPVYGQGMTVATMSSMLLDECLRRQKRRGRTADLSGLAQYFQKQLIKMVTGPWQMATNEDMRWPKTEGKHELDAPTRFIQRYMTQVLRTMPRSTSVSDAFFHVQNMIAPPTLLFRPGIMFQVVKTSLANRFGVVQN